MDHANPAAQIAKALGLPDNTTKAVILLQNGKAPVVRLTTVILKPELHYITQRFRLAPTR